MLKGTLSILAFFSMILAGCHKEKKDETTKLAALAILSHSPSQLSPQAKKNSALLINSLSSIHEMVTLALRTGQVTFLNDNKERNPDPKLFAQIHQLMLENTFQKNKHSKYLIGPSILSTSTGGLSCTTTGCEGTMNGTVRCFGTGTAVISNANTKVNFLSNPLNFNFESSIKGQITLNQCPYLGFNLMDYPNLMTSMRTGTLTIDSKSSNKINWVATDRVASYFNFTVEQEGSISSDEFKTDADTILKIENFQLKTNLTLESKYKSQLISTTNTELIQRGIYESNLNGSITTSGIINGESVNTTITYDKSRIYKYNVDCSYNYTTQTSNCNVTITE
jgi:hypothetical protein